MEICNLPLYFFYWRYFFCLFPLLLLCGNCSLLDGLLLGGLWVSGICGYLSGMVGVLQIVWLLAGVMPVLHPIDVDLRLLNVVRKYIFSEFLS